MLVGTCHSAYIYIYIYIVIHFNECTKYISFAAADVSSTFPSIAAEQQRKIIAVAVRYCVCVCLLRCFAYSMLVQWIITAAMAFEWNLWLGALFVFIFSFILNHLSWTTAVFDWNWFMVVRAGVSASLRKLHRYYSANHSGNYLMMILYNSSQ